MLDFTVGLGDFYLINGRIVGVFDRCDSASNRNHAFLALVVSIILFLAKQRQFFGLFDSLVAVRTHPGAQKSRSGHFSADDDDDDDRRTNRLLYPLLRMRARGKYCVKLCPH